MGARDPSGCALAGRRDEILAAFGLLRLGSHTSLRQGVDFDQPTGSDLFFVTLEKAEGHYSPTTMYRDYAIAPDLFHWESQSTTSVQSPTGQRYLQHQAKGTHVFLFVRHRKHEAGRTAAYTCLGAADYCRTREPPDRDHLAVAKPMPDDFFRQARLAMG